MTQHIHRGKRLIASPNWLVAFWECWCGARWLGPNLTHAERWCPLAPAGSGALPSDRVLSMAITQPEWAASSPLLYAVEARVGSVSTTFATVATPERALLVAHAMQAMFEKNPQGFRHAW